MDLQQAAGAQISDTTDAGRTSGVGELLGESSAAEAVGRAVDNLVALGYSSAQARFLGLVVGHGTGVFLSRQYLQMIGRQRGGAMAAFLAQLRIRGHVTDYPYRGRVRLYHVHHGTVIRAVGYQADRAWRLPDPVTIAERLLVLDYLVEQTRERRAVYVGRASLKVDLLREHFGVNEGWPTREVQIPRSTEGVAARPFPDRWPVGVARDGALELLFAEVLPTTTATGFRKFLLRHVALLERVTRARVVYLYPETYSPAAAVRRFEEVQLDPAGELVGLVRELGEYAELARKLGVPGLPTPSTEDLERYAALRQKYGDRRYDAVIAAGRQSRLAAVRALREMRAVELRAPLTGVSLQLAPFPHGYAVKGRLPG